MVAAAIRWRAVEAMPVRATSAADSYSVFGRLWVLQGRPVQLAVGHVAKVLTVIWTQAKSNVLEQRLAP